ncbi:hypothetical protein GCM10009546_60340 [Actinomadura livida]|uniref:Uncharacterized protein n=1 Tax=Actinomadura livida TaxID=79909 RepID=A0ABP3QJ38_9ACTN|nr:hypothetical protein GCM10010208_68390 [Actinomadura livida]
MTGCTSTRTNVDRKFLRITRASRAIIAANVRGSVARAGGGGAGAVVLTGYLHSGHCSWSK